MVTIACGRGGCIVLPEQPATNQEPPIYKPVALSPLPRRRCAYIYHRTVQRYGSKIDSFIVPAPCTAKPFKNGWCKTHQYIQAFLEEGARIGYPRLQINAGLWIGQGVVSWEAYAEHYPMGRRQEILQAIKLWKEEGQHGYS